MTTTEHLAALVSYKTISRDDNTSLIAHIARHLSQHGARTRILSGTMPGKANLIASFGPESADGIILSGHSDVVPTDGQNWSSDPFHLTPRGDHLLARGAVDMKGFIASAMHLATHLPKLQKPLHIAISHDEEIGCVGVRSMLQQLADEGFHAAGCIVGEPTNLRVATGHKGKFAGCICCHGQAAHSANPTLGCNAIYLAAGMIAELQNLQTWLHDHGAHDAAYALPYSTIHTGTINGGTVLNIVPDYCEIKFEIRFLPGDDPAPLIARLREAAQNLIAPHLAHGHNAAITITETNNYPGLSAPAVSPFIAMVRQAAGDHATTKLGFGSEAGLFAQFINLPAIVCGPGSIDRAHRADEYITSQELDDCDMFLNRIVNYLA